MFEIFSDGELIYSDRVPLPEYKAVDPVLELEGNCAGSLTLTFLPSHKGYSNVTMMQSVIIVKRNGTEIWEGRPLNEEFDFYNRRKVYCEGELAYLNDVCQPQSEYMPGLYTYEQFIEQVLNNYNERVPAERRFYLGYIQGLPIGEVDEYRYTQYEKTMETINNLVEEEGLHMVIRKVDEDVEVDGVTTTVRKRYLDFMKGYGSESPQKIQFGINMTDLNKSLDYTELCTVLLPLGQVNEDSSLYRPIEYEREYGKVIQIGDDQHPHVVSAAEAGVPPEEQNNYYISKLLPSVYGATSMDFSRNKYHYTGQMRGDFCYYTVCEGSTGVSVKWKTHSGQQVDQVKDEDIDYISDQPKYAIVAGYDQGAVSDLQTVLSYLPKVSEALDSFLTIESVNDGALYLKNDELFEQYGWIEKQITWSDIDSAATLKEKAEQYLRDGQFDNLCLTINAIDMQALGIDVGSLKIYDQVHVVSKPHGLGKQPDNPTLDRYFPINKLHLALARPSDTSLEVGYQREQNLTGVNNETNDELLKKIGSKPSFSKILDSAKKNAASMIVSSPPGYVSLVYNEETREITDIVISDLKDYTSPQAKGWRWNQNGLMAFTGGWASQTTQLALTIDGKIVADAVTTGTMLADRILGGVLHIGDWDGASGDIQVKDGSGHLAARIYVDGNDTYLECGNASGGGPWTRFHNGALEFGIGWGTDTLTVTGSIRGDVSLEGQLNGIIVEADYYILSASAVAVGEPGQVAGATHGGAIQVLTDVNVVDGQLEKVYKTLDFKHGLLLQLPS